MGRAIAIRASATRGLFLGAIAVLTLPHSLAAQADPEVARLRADLRREIATYRSTTAEWSVLVTSLDQGDTLFSIAPNEPRAPASNLKLLTTAAALASLGPEFRFQTYLLATGPVRDGVLEGDLVLYGTGDPGISDRFHRRKDEVFHLLAEQLVEQGIHTVTGDLIADESHLAGPLRPEGWDPRDLNDHFAAAVSALSYNENVVSFRVIPAARAGEAPEVQTIPENAGLEVLNSARTVNGQSRPRLAILRDDPIEPFRIEGEVSVGSRDVWRQMTVPRPAHFAASALLAVLGERGVAVGGRIRLVDDPAASVVTDLVAPRAEGRPRARILARHTSQPLREYLAVINQRSNNLFAELVFRTLGRATSGASHQRANERAVKSALEGLGVPSDDLVLLDGSGLSAGNRVSPATFVHTFDRLAAGPVWPEYWATLPEAGRRRGLPRMYRTAAAGNLRAKTGTIEGVSALSGVVRSRDEERLAFSIVLNGGRSTSAAKRVENRIGARLAEFARAPERKPAVVVAETPGLPAAGAYDQGRYQVRNGENLTVIARRHGVSLEEVLRANPDLEPNRIYAGQWLTIPRSAGGGSER